MGARRCGAVWENLRREASHSSARCSKIMFFALQELPAQKRRRRKTAQVVIPRLATCNHIKNLDRSLEHAGKALGLQFCSNFGDLVGLGMLEAVETGVRPSTDVLALVGDQPAPCTLHLASDQEQTQVSGHAFSEDPNGLRLTMTAIFDIFHRFVNCLNNGTAKAGLTPIFYAAVMIYNIGYGPWETCLWWQQMLAQIDDLAATMDADNALLLALWKGILVDLKMDHKKADADVGKAARQKFIQSMKAQGKIDFRNKKVKPNSWMSFNKAHDVWDSVIRTRAMLLGCLCMRKGWITSLEDLMDPADTSAFKNCGDKPVVPGGTSGHIRSAKAKIDALKKKAGHSCAAVAKLASDNDVVGGIRMLGLGSRIVYTYFSFLEQKLKGPTDCAAFSEGWASWKWLQPLKATQKQLENTGELRRCGFKVNFPKCLTSQSATSLDPQVAYQDSLAKTLGTYTFHISSEITGHMLWWTAYYPGKFAVLQSGDDEVVKKGMEDFRTDCEAFWWAKAGTSELPYAFGALHVTLECTEPRPPTSPN